MKLPKVENSKKYVGLYVIDFGDHCGVGYTAEEVAMLLESEQFAEVKVYKIHQARPDGTMELQGVVREKFQWESGMFFHCPSEEIGRKDFEQLREWSEQQQPPGRAQLQQAEMADGTLLIALIYPAEYEQEMGDWLTESGFQGHGPIDAGVSQVQRYYQSERKVAAKEQLWPTESLRARGFEELLASRKTALQR